MNLDIPDLGLPTLALQMPRTREFDPEGLYDFFVLFYNLD